MATQSRDVQTVPMGDGWINKVGGAQVGPTHRTEEVAVAAGRLLARANGSEHTIHGKDGTIKQKNSYGNDPRDIRG
jgi:Uncharacterized protein conserved in bacteria (DUF2188)